MDTSAPAPPNFHANPDAIAIEINEDGNDAGTFHGFTWTDVKRADVDGCKTLGVVMDLIASHLS